MAPDWPAILIALCKWSLTLECPLSRVYGWGMQIGKHNVGHDEHSFLEALMPAMA
jgi:hypothetical protein